VAVKADGRRPTALSALAAIVDPSQRGRGLARRVLETMADIARRHGLKTLVAPVRPTLKQHYPLTPMEKYVKWTRAGGACFDPWLQVHQRMGAEIMQVAPKAMVITDTVAKWQEWTGLRFPESGPYVVPGAFQPVTIDVRRNIGRYEEANVWMRHPAVRAERLGSEARAE
jgi:GNAT superfamily N-acetyltransferase